MNATGERRISGRALVAGGLAAAALVTVAAVVFGPALRQDVLQEQRPRTLREPVADGRHDGEVWEAVGHYDGTANCVELRYAGEVVDRACDTGAPQTVVTTLPEGGPTIAYGVAPEDAGEHAVRLDDGDVVTTPVVAGELGFPVGFWAVELPAGATVAEEAGTS